MPPDDDHDRHAELAVGHALSALEPSDETAFIEHARACSQCARTLDETHEVMSAFAASSTPEISPQPPESLRTTIMSRIAETPQELTAPSPETAVVGADAFGPPDELASRRRHSRWRRSIRAPWYAVAAVLVVLLALAGADAYLWKRGDATQVQLARAQRVVTCVRNTDCEALPLRATSGRSVPAVALVRDGRVTLMVDGLAVNAESKTYVLWQKCGRKLDSIGSFDVSHAGVSLLPAGRLGDSLARTDFLAVSEENGGRPPQAPTFPIAVARVPATSTGSYGGNVPGAYGGDGGTRTEPSESPPASRGPGRGAGIEESPQGGGDNAGGSGDAGSGASPSPGDAENEGSAGRDSSGVLDDLLNLGGSSGSSAPGHSGGHGTSDAPGRSGSPGNGQGQGQGKGHGNGQGNNEGNGRGNNPPGKPSDVPPDRVKGTAAEGIGEQLARVLSAVVPLLNGHNSSEAPAR